MRRSFTLMALVCLGQTLHCSSEPGQPATIPESTQPKQRHSDGGKAGGSPTGGTDGGAGFINVGGGDEDAGVSNAPDAAIEDIGCGNDRIEPGEACDDGNSRSGDGCSSDCASIEKDYVCPTPGERCIFTVECGDGVISGVEICDDGNAAANDGCSDRCEPEDGWTCPVAGRRCEAAECGDGIIAGNEQCEDDDSPPADGDGCDASCKLEDGYVCDAPGTACRQTVCNDGTKEGSEPCDDGNQIIGDGCNPFCEVEPDCSMGACVSACGDGIILPGDSEACDDGNTRDGDGCSSTCQVEEGYSCETIAGQLPDTLEVPVTYRDFNHAPKNGGTRHPDFEAFSGSSPTPGLVESALGPDGKPVYADHCDNDGGGACPNGQQMTTKANFDQWYANDHPADVTLVTRVTLTRVGTTGAYKTPAGQLFPLDGAGYVAAGTEDTSDGHNFGFTTEIRSWFEFEGGEQLNFSGDDDVWVFVNGTLVLDLGGLHSREPGSFTLNADGTATSTTAGASIDLGLEAGKVYEIALFHAERHTDASNFELTLTGFTSARSECTSICGDGIVTGDEVCDDGVNDGSYGSCTAHCQGHGPFCGDGEVQDAHEACDDGVNLTTYSMTGEPGCGPGCKPSSFCGDGQVDSTFGEQCDDEKNDGGYGGCAAGCVLGPRCGDGKVQRDAGESCDDGNTVSSDGCSSKCQSEVPE